MIFLCFSCRSILISLTAVIGKPSFSFSRRTFDKIFALHKPLKALTNVMHIHQSKFKNYLFECKKFAIFYQHLWWRGCLVHLTICALPNLVSAKIYTVTYLRFHLLETWQKTENFMFTLSTILYMSTQRSPQSRPSSVIGPTWATNV